MGRGGGGADGGAGKVPLLPKKNAYTRCVSHAGDELQSFRSCLRWMGVDQSDPFRMSISCAVFIILGIVVPILSYKLLASSRSSRRAYDVVVQLSLSSISAVSYFFITGLVRKFGLRRSLFLDKLVGESDLVLHGYMAELHRSFRILSLFVMPCFFIECAYRVWWYVSGSGPGRLIPFLGNHIATDVFCCVLELASWIYRTAIFFLVCVLFRLGCHLQILRLQDFAAGFQNEMDVASVLKAHLKIRKHLKVISHRYRNFIVAILCLVTMSNFASLLLTTRPHAKVTFSNTGELALCSIGLVMGLCICLRCAAKITHKAQAITSTAAAWHVFATVDYRDPESPPTATSHPINPPVNSNTDADDESEDEVGDEDDLGEIDEKKLHPHQMNTISYQRRQALVTYFENNRAGITVFGFVVDRAWIHTIFMVELSLVLWLLGKTIGIS
ncbi:hypothetical protein J5N97_026603 [Dioscorea zingiberensis]|uniref:Uncharacterized protein n=1 Tax=Dioscorea zingiberensis TaxID=325984 RepID=A0A9D5C2Q7_9LILI|nr:hypothetical protein J5N97_026603 [Dioscorea zingiberensis]